MKTLITTALIALSLFAQSSARAGGTLEVRGWRAPFAQMQQQHEHAWTHGPNDIGMAIWNQAADMFRETPFDGSWGRNDVSEFGGFPSQTDLTNTWGFNWSGSLALTCVWWNTGSGQIFESDVIFNPAYSWSNDAAYAAANPNTYFYPPVLMHELGHAWGLQINGETYDYDVPTVMHAIHKDTTQASYTLHATDAKLMRDTYRGATALPATTDVAVFPVYVANGDLRNSYPTQFNYNTGDAITIRNLLVENIGPNALSNVRIRIFISRGNSVRTSDPMLGEWAWSTFPGEAYGTYDFTGSIPTNLADGQYTVGAVVTRNGYQGDQNGNNDVAILRTRINVTNPGGGGGGGCTDDAFEPNDLISQARTVAPTNGGAYQNLTVCPGNSDWYRTWVDQGETVTASIAFAHAVGDLSLYLFDDRGNYYGGSTSATDGETVSAVAPHTGWYLFHANGPNSAQNSYSLAIDIDPAPGGGGGGGGPTTFVPGDILNGNLSGTGQSLEAEFEGVEGMKLFVEPQVIIQGNLVRVSVLDPAGLTVDSRTFRRFTDRKETFRLRSSGTFTLRIESTRGSGSFQFKTWWKLPKENRKVSRAVLRPIGSGVSNPVQLRALSGTVLDVGATRRRGTPDTIMATILRPDGTPIDLSTSYGFDGISLVQVLLDQPGVYTLRYSGFPAKKNRLKLTIRPTTPTAGNSVITLQ